VTAPLVAQALAACGGSGEFSDGFSEVEAPQSQISILKRDNGDAWDA